LPKLDFLNFIVANYLLPSERPSKLSI
jgi:hypothetical protein